MKKLAALLLSTVLGTTAIAQDTQGLEDVPPTYDLPENNFFISLPMICVTDSSKFQELDVQGYELAFLGETVSQSGGLLYVSIFVHPETSAYTVMLVNKMAGGSCEVTSGHQSAFFDIEKIGI